MFGGYESILNNGERVFKITGEEVTEEFKGEEDEQGSSEGN